MAPEDVFDAIRALDEAGFTSESGVDEDAEPDALYVMRHGNGSVDILVASAEPESTVIAEATKTSIFGITAPVATLEHLVLMYLYSNQPRHMGDLARIVLETNVDIGAVERYLADVHPEMLRVLAERVDAARNPKPAPARPARRRPPK